MLRNSAIIEDSRRSLLGHPTLRFHARRRDESLTMLGLRLSKSAMLPSRE
jgi:hypothetical protein